MKYVREDIRTALLGWLRFKRSPAAHPPRAQLTLDHPPDRGRETLTRVTRRKGGAHLRLRGGDVRVRF